MSDFRSPSWRGRLERALGAYERTWHPPLPGRRNDIPAGVLVPLVGEVDPVCVLTERTPTLRHHAGEICFPGGRRDEGDASLADTAVREAREELGMVDVRVVGELSTMPLPTSEHRLHPFVGVVGRAPLAPSAAEVRRVVELPLSELYALPSLHAIAWRDGDRDALAPVFETGGRLLFGASAYVLYELLVVAAPVFDAAVPVLRTGEYGWSDVFGDDPPRDG